MGTSNNIFCLYVDNFRVNYFSKDNADCHLNSIGKHYTVLNNWEGRNYLGLTIEWNYKEGYANILMLEYVVKSLENIYNPKPKRPQYAPNRWKIPAYGRLLQMAPAPDESALINKKITKHIQSIFGTLFYNN